jgi:hypothetical protein
MESPGEFAVRTNGGWAESTVNTNQRILHNYAYGGNPANQGIENYGEDQRTLRVDWWPSITGDHMRVMVDPQLAEDWLVPRAL